MILSEIAEDRPIIIDLVKNLLKKKERVYLFAHEAQRDVFDIAPGKANWVVLTVATHAAQWAQNQTWELPRQVDKLSLEKRPDGWEIVQNEAF